jgi:hypothetical protein
MKRFVLEADDALLERAREVAHADQAWAATAHGSGSRVA